MNLSFDCKNIEVSAHTAHIVSITATDVDVDQIKRELELVDASELQDKATEIENLNTELDNVKSEKEALQTELDSLQAEHDLLIKQLEL